MLRYFETAQKMYERLGNYHDREVEALLYQGRLHILDKKFLSAGSALDSVDALLDTLEEPAGVRINRSARPELTPIPTPILRQHWYLESGNLHLSHRRTKVAASFFTKCFRIGEIFDP